LKKKDVSDSNRNLLANRAYLRQLTPQGGRHFTRKAASKTRCLNEIELISAANHWKINPLTQARG